jgi:hypothetical protein
MEQAAYYFKGERLELVIAGRGAPFQDLAK